MSGHNNNSPPAARAAGMWAGGEAPSPPASSERRAGIGLTMFNNESGELVVRKVIPGGPAAFSCEIAVGDVLTQVDGVNVMGDTTEDVARRIVGPEGQAITMCFKIRRRETGGQIIKLDHTVTLIRQVTLTMPDRLITANVGLGIEVGKAEGGLMDVRNLSNGGAAALSGKLQIGDVICYVDGKDISSMPPTSDKPAVLLGPPYSRVSVVILRAGRVINLDMVRTVPLLGEYLVRHSSYRNALSHAILQPAPPQDPARSPAMFASGASSRVGAAGMAMRQPPTPGLPPTGVSQGRAFNRTDMLGFDRRFERVMDTGGEAMVSPNAAMMQRLNLQSGNRGSPMGFGGSMHSSNPASLSSSHEHSGLEEGASISSVDGMLSRSSTASRDSIALSVRQLIGDTYDALRTVEGRENTFTDDWPHRGNPKLLKGKMANAGFIYTPDGEANDKVTCVYCGLELAMWEPGDDPWSEHHEGSPGCVFWRRSSSAGEKVTREMWTGYGSPYHSLYRSAATEMQAHLQSTLAAQSVAASLPPVRADFQRTIDGTGVGFRYP